MIKYPPKLVKGFDPENVERIYHGEPALVGNQTPADILADRQFETICLLAEGMSYKEIAKERGVGLPTVRSQIHEGFQRLGIAARSQVAGYFPLDIEDERVTSRKLQDLRPARAARRMDILHAFSVGFDHTRVEADAGVTYDAVNTHVYNAGVLWNASGVISVTRIANAIRARYVQALDTTSNSSRQNLTELTLRDFAEIEPAALLLIKMRDLILAKLTHRQTQR